MVCVHRAAGLLSEFDFCESTQSRCGNKAFGANTDFKIIFCSYNDDVEGVILAFNEDRIVSTTARVHPYFPLVRVIAEATLTVFKPQVGAKVIGVVNKVTEDYIGLLVLGFINVAIARKDIRSDFLAPDLYANCWRSKKNPEHSIRLSDSVLFEIESIKQDGPYLALVGALQKRTTGNTAFVAARVDKKPRNKRKFSKGAEEEHKVKDIESPETYVDSDEERKDFRATAVQEATIVDKDSLGVERGKTAKKKLMKKSIDVSDPSAGELLRVIKKDKKKTKKKG